MNEYIAVIDMGSSKIKIIMGRLSETNEIDIIGIGESDNTGIKHGIINNLDDVNTAINKAVKHCEALSGTPIESLYIGISGGHIHSVDCYGTWKVKNPELGISKNDINQVINTAKAISIAPDREVIHSIPKYFKVDGQGNIEDPINMYGMRLEASVHLVTASVTTAQNIITSVRNAGYNYLNLILNPIAASNAILSEDEKELGIILIDIGGGTTDIAAYVNNSICFSTSMSIGGEQITKDIAFKLKTDLETAEKLKIKYGNCISDSEINSEKIVIPGIGGLSEREIDSIEIIKIINYRIREIFEMINNQIEREKLKNIAVSGIVLCGGCALTPGIQKAAENIIDLPVRIGFPKNITGITDISNNPAYTSAIGLLKHAINSDYKTMDYNEENIFSRIIEMFKNAFAMIF